MPASCLLVQITSLSTDDGLAQAPLRPVGLLLQGQKMGYDGEDVTEDHKTQRHKTLTYMMQTMEVSAGAQACMTPSWGLSFFILEQANPIPCWPSDKDEGRLGEGNNQPGPSSTGRGQKRHRVEDWAYLWVLTGTQWGREVLA
ncbi:hypothetical protein CB1_001108045 [Camelus ferus]|nr:hypothetical protein CB1_001108045 [Camelus ferus]